MAYTLQFVLYPKLGRKSQRQICLDYGLGAIDMEHLAVAWWVAFIPPAIPHSSPLKQTG